MEVKFFKQELINKPYEESIKKGNQNSKFEIAEVLFHNKIDYSKSYN